MSTQNTYVGVAALTMARTVAGGYVNIYAGDPVTADIELNDLARLVDEGFIGVLVVEVPDNDDDLVVDPVAPRPGSEAAVLAEVGEDKGLAEVALAEEQAKEKPRKGLVAKLEAIVAVGAGS